MKVFIALRLQRVIKKLSKNEKNALDQSIEIISKQPKIGTLKTGDLAGTRVFKYTFNRQSVLLAYGLSLDEKQIVLIGYGSHENFYRDLNRQQT